MVELNESQGGQSGSNPLRLDESRDSLLGRLDCLSSGQRQTKGGLQGSSPLRSDGSWVIRRGRLDCTSISQKTLEESLLLNMDYKSPVQSGQMILMVVRQGGWTQ
jgi:hypothetical protein